MDEDKHCHVVGWEQVCRSKDMGGLGLGTIVLRNRALLGMWLWRGIKENETLWKNLITSIYGLQDNGWDLGDSQSYRWDVYFRRNLNDVELGEFTILYGVLVTVRVQVGYEDFRVWLGDSSGVFSVKSVYESFFHVQSFLVFSCNENIWKVPIIHKIQIFSWTVALGKLPTTFSAKKMADLCFKSSMELRCYWVFPQRARGMFIIEPGLSSGTRFKVFWYVIVHLTIGSLWLERNNRIFNDLNNNVNEVWELINFRVASSTSRIKEFNNFTISDLVRDWKFVMVSR
ncbi:uncharacterized protein [Primulina eburnea]|uniref:uncharacterized protein n=1 Tax=Primulina eburnea TaxID=1245227 RepID=UPI003C6C554F